VVYMKNIIIIIAALGPGLLAGSAVLADEVEFTTLPQPIQTTVIRETHIANPTFVTRVVRDQTGTYAVTVRGDTGERIVYVNNEGAIVQQGAAQTTTTTTVQAPTQPIHSTQTTTTVAQPAEDGTVVTSDQVQQNLPRYKLIEKKGRKEIYLDNQTGQKVTVKREKD
jgi:formylmethanofuran dehydrogenase subunit C